MACSPLRPPDRGLRRRRPRRVVAGGGSTIRADRGRRGAAPSFAIASRSKPAQNAVPASRRRSTWLRPEATDASTSSRHRSRSSKTAAESALRRSGSFRRISTPGRRSSTLPCSSFDASAPSGNHAVGSGWIVRQLPRPNGSIAVASADYGRRSFRVPGRSRTRRYRPCHVPRARRPSMTGIVTAVPVRIALR